jgi:hypothetical protein
MDALQGVFVTAHRDEHDRGPADGVGGKAGIRETDMGHFYGQAVPDEATHEPSGNVQSRGRRNVKGADLRFPARPA